jgi:hypothetical protein
LKSVVAIIVFRVNREKPMADRVYTEQPRETVVVEREVNDTVGRSNTGVVIAAIIIIGLILLFLITGNPFAGSGGTTNVNTPAPAANQ